MSSPQTPERSLPSVQKLLIKREATGRTRVVRRGDRTNTCCSERRQDGHVLFGEETGRTDMCCSERRQDGHVLFGEETGQTRVVRRGDRTNTLHVLFGEETGRTCVVRRGDRTDTCCSERRQDGHVLFGEETGRTCCSERRQDGHVVRRGDRTDMCCSERRQDGHVLFGERLSSPSRSFPKVAFTNWLPLRRSSHFGATKLDRHQRRSRWVGVPQGKTKRKVRMSKGRRKREVRKSKGRRKRDVRKSKGRRKREVRKSKGRRKREVHMSKGRRKREVRKSKGRRKREVHMSKGRRKREVHMSKGRRKRETSQMRVTAGYLSPVSPPMALQYRGCGKSGAFISIAHEWLTRITHAAEIPQEAVDDLVQEWAHFRWGVFEESGCHSDPRYLPYFYKYEPEIKRHTLELNTCSRRKIPGLFRDFEMVPCDPGVSDTCSWVSNERPEVIQSRFTCRSLFDTDGTSRTRNAFATTPQQVMCNLRKSLAIIGRHADQIDRPRERVPFEEPKFQVVSRQESIYILMIDISIFFAAQKKSSSGLDVAGELCTALQSMLATKPPNTYLEIHFFGTLVVHFPQTEFYPCKFEQVFEMTGFGRCIGCALNTVVQRSHAFRGNAAVILLTAGAEKNDIDKYTPEQIQQAGIKWTSVEDFSANQTLLPPRFLGLTISPEGVPDVMRIAKFWQGEFRLLSLNHGPGFVETVLNDIFKYDDLVHQPFRELLLYEPDQNFGRIKSSEFVVERGTQDITIQHITFFEDTMEITPEEIPVIELIDPKGNTTYPYSALELVLYNGVRYGYFIPKPAHGRWKLKARMNSLARTSLLVQSHQLESPVTVQAWTENDIPGLIKIMALILYSHHPLRDVSVQAILMHESGQQFDVVLKDDGYGADITPGDGVYSSQVLNSNIHPGNYTIIINVDNPPNTGAYIQLYTNGPRSMGALGHGCAVASGFQKEIVPQFTRTYVQGDLTVVQLQNPTPDIEGIWTLMLGRQDVQDDYTVELKWSLDDIQNFVVKELQVHCANDMYSLQEIMRGGNPDKKSTAVIPVPNPQTTNAVTFSFKKPSPTGVRYCALKIDGQSGMSNPVAISYDVSKPSKFVPTTTTRRPPPPPIAPRRPQEKERGFMTRGYTDYNINIVSIMLGLTGGLLVCAIPMIIMVAIQWRSSGNKEPMTMDDMQHQSYPMDMTAQQVYTVPPGIMAEPGDEDFSGNDGRHKKKRRKHKRRHHRSSRRHSSYAGEDEENMAAAPVV
ncbi:unnamed protein product [Cyprideis torosa]|uniref:Calcium-activated chloride channel N-terminal domain-containing protein n=1 Tax=Cyprideis torosa TaxID=163714 RepID=A0A7R8WFB2_9CRUS|nr:unnamed protein product [Cyprideis torosa]CAG0891662.1 unnamed protein product [Cyprideis torosa]